MNTSTIDIESPMTTKENPAMRRVSIAAVAVALVVTGIGFSRSRPAPTVVVRSASAPIPAVVEEEELPTTTTTAAPAAPVASPITTAVAPAHRVKPRGVATTPTTLDPNEVVWIRDDRGYCGQTSRASADPSAIDSTCPANQPAPLEGHAANPDAEDENDVVYVYENGYCKPMGRAESGQEHNSPECVGYTEGKQYWYVDPATGQPSH